MGTGERTGSKLTDEHVIGLLEAACLQAGRELTPDELQGLLGLQDVHQRIITSMRTSPSPSGSSSR